MSSEDQSELKAGHPPAVKAGGMRITQHKPVHEKIPETKKDEDEDTAELEETKPSTSPKQQLIISGVPARVNVCHPLRSMSCQNMFGSIGSSVAKLIGDIAPKGDADFPTEAVQAFHTKPMPSHDYRPITGRTNIIHQPRK